MSPLKPIRVLVVDDSLLFRQSLTELLNKDPYIEVVGSAADSFEAMEKIHLLSPDVISLDVEMPQVNGIDFLKTLMPQYPLPVVVVSGLPMNALDALDAGAVDFVGKPLLNGPEKLRAFVQELSAKIKIASLAKVKMRHKMNSSPTPLLITPSHDHRVVAIGASTGGTEAILEVIRNLPVRFPGVVIVQHMPPVFTKMYAERLNKICPSQVKEATHLDRVESGTVLIAAGEHHLRLAQDNQGYYVKSERGDKVSGHCPSVDVLFESVAHTAGHRAVGVLLTGMGSDGAKGLKAIRDKGGFTIGQDKETSVVYGMPMVAQNIGAVTVQLPIQRIGNELIRHLNRQAPL